MQEQMSDVSRDMEIPRKNQKEKAEMKDTFDGLISGLDISKERISELKNTSVIPPPSTEKRGEEKKEEKLGRTKKERTSNTCGTASKSIIYVIRIPEKGKEKETAIFEVILLRTFQKVDTDTKPQIQEALGEFQVG